MGGRGRWPAASNNFHRAVWPHGLGSVCDDRDDGIIMMNDDLRARDELAHDVSHRNDGVGAPERLKPCRKRSMMRMTPPQSGQAGTLAHVRASESPATTRHRLALSAHDREVCGGGRVWQRDGRWP